MADLKCQIGTLLKQHRTMMCTVVYTYLMCASWHIKAMLQYRFQTLERKPCPRSQSYIRPTSVGPDTRLFPSPHPLSSPSLFPSFTHTVLPCIHVLLYMYMYMVMELYAKCMFALFHSWTYAAFRKGGGGRILLIGDLNICFECYSILNTCDVRQSY